MAASSGWCAAPCSRSSSSATRRRCSTGANSPGSARWTPSTTPASSGQTPEVRQALSPLLAGLELGRPLAAAPETAPDRVALLRRAFDQAMNDPELVAEAARLQLDINKRDAAATEATVRSLYATPKSAL